jgi:glycosyltransferase involved in cell wall biosynthesis
MSGGGVKTKAIDTLARGKAVLSTQTGAEGIDPMVCGNLLQVIEDGNWDAFTHAMISYLNSEEGQLPNLFYEKYSWPGIIKNIENKLDQLA